MVKIKFLKVAENAELPSQNNKGNLTGDSGFDIKAIKDRVIKAGETAVVPVGFKVAYITPGYWFKIEARSGLSFKHNLLPHPGIVDNIYRGELGILVYNHSKKDYRFEEGDKVAQLVVYPLFDVTTGWADEVSESERGENGFGSSGK